MYQPYQPQKKNSGIWGYMRDAERPTSLQKRYLVKPDQTAQNRAMTVSECESLILKLAVQYKNRPHMMTKRQLLAMLDARNLAAKRTGKPQYASVQQFIEEHNRSLSSPGE